MRRMLFTALSLLLFSTPVPAGETEPAIDEKFAALAHEIEGFLLVLNTPPAPDVKFLRAPREVVSFDDFRGKVVLLNLWATWCPPCIREMPGLNALQENLGGDDFEVLAVASGRQGRQAPAEFLEKAGLGALTLYTDHHSVLMRAFENETLPMSLLIDRKGRVMGGVVGATEWDSPEAAAAIRYLIDQEG